MRKLATRFLADRSGATALEYGLIAALISIAIVGAAVTMGGGVRANFEAVQSEVQRP